MEADAEKEIPGPEPGASHDRPPETEAVEELKGLAREGSAMVQDFLQLLAVEGRLAGRSLAAMLMLAVALGVLVVCAWTFMAGAAGLWLIEQDILYPSQAMLAIGGLNLVLAVLAWLLIVRLSRNLGFREFLSAIQGLLPAPKQQEDKR